MNSLSLILLIVIVTSSASFRLAPRSLSSRSMHRMSEPKYEIVPLEKPNIQSAAAVTGGILGFVLGGPVWGVAFAALSNFVSKKEDDYGDALRGFGKVVIESYNFLNKINSKYEITNKVSSAVSSVVSSVNTESESLDTIKKTYTETISKIDEINKEYDLVNKGTEVIAAAATLSDAAIEKVVELNAKYDFVATAKKFVLDLIEKIKDAKKE